MKRPALWYVAGALVLAAGLYFVYTGSGRTTGGIGPGSLSGTRAQSFTAPLLSGGAGSLDAYHGKIVVMNLWASWCPPCRAEMPDLERLSVAFRNRNLVVLGVNEGESAERAGAFAASLGIHFPVLLDQNQSYGRVYAALGLPTTIIIDPSGTVARGFDGELSYPQMVAAVTPLLSKQ